VRQEQSAKRPVARELAPALSASLEPRRTLGFERKVTGGALHLASGTRQNSIGRGERLSSVLNFLRRPWHTRSWPEAPHDRFVVLRPRVRRCVAAVTVWTAPC